MPLFSFTQYPNADAAINKLLNYLSINIDPQAISAELEKHPDYPSLLAISDVLTNFDIKNAAFRVEHNSVANVPCPFIAHMHLNSGEFLVVNQIEGDNVWVSNNKSNRRKQSLNEFKKTFAGVVLTAEAPLTSTYTATTTLTTFKTLKAPAIATGLALILLSAIVFHTNYIASLSWQVLLLTLFKTAGLITSILLLIQSIDSNNPLVQVLCQSKGKTNCNAILSSKAATVFKGLTWSEAGFFYFAGTWLLLLFGGNSTATWWALALLNFVSLPYTIYSIYYQAKVAKQWCVLCCTVQALLWLEFFSLTLTLSKGEGTVAFFTSLSFGEGRGELKPLFLKLQELKPLKQQLRTFKYNAELFSQMLSAQPRYTQPDEEWCIVLGNVEANNIVTMVTNPYCPPCA
jgi:uncharacterized membrane protein